ncbi:MAG: MBL fold metallo-hydrolase, partial [Clostridiales bacterium]|nr:MBL fold metallo-hydrolase [Clostridiales bacterium]
MKLTVYGCRGSVSCECAAHARYGGNTACFKLETGEGALILDAGSGLMRLDEELRRTMPDYPRLRSRPFDILLSHLHFDHTIGLSTFTPVWEDSGVRVFTPRENPFGAFEPPWWPVSMPCYATAGTVLVKPGEAFQAGGLSVAPFSASHSDGCLSFCITDGKKSLIYMLDFELGPLPAKAFDALSDRCRGADLIIFDASYHPDDYAPRRGWGHSTVLDG